MKPLVPALALLLAACSSAHEEPGAVTAEQDRQLDEAAASLDANSVAAQDNAADDTTENAQ